MISRERDEMMSLQRLRLSRRKLLRGALGASMAGLLAACGGSGDDDDESSASEETSTEEASPEATATEETSAATESATETAEAETATESPATEAATRTVETSFGPVEIPANPQRVLALGEEFMLADLLDLGIVPIASTSSLPDGFYALDEFDTSNIERLSNTEPDFEHFVALQPDLLITYTAIANTIGIDMLNQLAPTVAIDTSDYREAYLTLARIFGVEERADERLAEYQLTAERYGEELGGSGRTASVVTIYPGASDITVYLGGTADLPQGLLDMGFTLAPNTGDMEAARSLNRTPISLEQVNLLTGEDLFMMQSDSIEGEPESLEEMTSTEVWQQIPTVTAGRVHIFDRLGYPGVHGRIRILDDIKEALNQ